ncbi:hypothetical protein K503DRAFT_776203 [Rhizopogon vinicolor AM-OR11-026]|uniref:Signal peptidase complex catalytic subunit SEC11 n=1 Tax=Rhizopogon vinicolor AM-OR11-026 TaxID=1314800 RepID=A0A1B7MJU3_9AGAM|nr:hypothetical protein K503DRAFT_776203 [Rhizopogon vinicolor AM-OR11-026]
MQWKCLGLFLNTESPIVVVLSGSMEPAFYRGDLFLTNPASEPYHIGDITVYKIHGADIPIVHRVMEIRDVFIPFENSTQSRIGKTRLAKLKFPAGVHQLLLTKGDNSHVDDIELYHWGLGWLERRHIVGKVRGYVFFTLFIFVPYFSPSLTWSHVGSPMSFPWYITVYARILNLNL